MRPTSPPKSSADTNTGPRVVRARGRARSTSSNCPGWRYVRRLGRPEPDRAEPRVPVVEGHGNAGADDARAAVADPHAEPPLGGRLSETQGGRREVRPGVGARRRDDAPAHRSGPRPAVPEAQVARLLARDRAVVVHVRHAVLELVPDPPGVRPAPVGLPVDPHAGSDIREPAVGHRDDLGLPVGVDVGDHHGVRHRGAPVRVAEQDDPVPAPEEAQVALGGVDELGRAVPVEVEGRDTDVRRAVLVRGPPLHRPVGLEHGEVVASGDGDLGRAVAVHVGHGRGAGPGVGPHRLEERGPPFHGAVVLEQEDPAPGHEDDLREGVLVEVADRGVAVLDLHAADRARVPPRDLAGGAPLPSVGRVADEDLRPAVEVEVHHEGVGAPVAALPGDRRRSIGAWPSFVRTCRPTTISGTPSPSRSAIEGAPHPGARRPSLVHFHVPSCSKATSLVPP